MFHSSKYLMERAAYNSIDISEYQIYPEDMIRQILYALENGCSRKQIANALQKNSRASLPKAIKAMIGVPDTKSYLEKLVANKKYQTMDLKEDIKALILLLPSDEHAHKWKSQLSGFTKEVLEAYVKETEPIVSRLFLYLLAVDLWIEIQVAGRYMECVTHVRQAMMGNRNESEINQPSFEEAEVIADYIAVFGLDVKTAVFLCGRMACELQYTPRQVYRLMYAAALIAEAGKNGIAASVKFVNMNKIPAIYKITETGIFRKKMYASICKEESLTTDWSLLNCQKGKEQALTKLYHGLPNRNQILIQQICNIKFY